MVCTNLQEELCCTTLAAAAALAGVGVGGGWGGGGSRFSKMLKGLRYSFLCAGQTAVM